MKIQENPEISETHATSKTKAVAETAAIAPKLEPSPLDRLLRLMLALLILLLAAYPLSRYAVSRLSPETACTLLQSMSNADHGDNIGEVIAGTRQSEVEYSSYFDQDGQKLFEHTDYHPHKAATHPFLWGLLKRAGACIHLHNHTNLSSPSLRDYSHGFNYYFDEAISVVVNPEDLYLYGATGTYPAPAEIQQVYQEVAAEAETEAWTECQEAVQVCSRLKIYLIGLPLFDDDDSDTYNLYVKAFQELLQDYRKEAQHD